MADRTGVQAAPGGIPRVPWTDRERAANKALVTHFAACSVCRGGRAVCDTGTELLAALKAANAAAKGVSRGC
jgi:hypothetical protein